MRGQSLHDLFEATTQVALDAKQQRRQIQPAETLHNELLLLLLLHSDPCELLGLLCRKLPSYGG